MLRETGAKEDLDMRDLLGDTGREQGLVGCNACLPPLRGERSREVW